MGGVFIVLEFYLWARQNLEPFWALGESNTSMGSFGRFWRRALSGLVALGPFGLYSTIAPLDGRMVIKWPDEPSKEDCGGRKQSSKKIG